MEHYNLIIVFLGLTFLSLSTALIGVFTFLQKKTLISEALGHAALPGLILGFLLTSGEKNLFFLLLGIFFSSFLAIGFINWVQKWTVLKPEAIIAIALSVFYGLGVFLFSWTQHFDNFEQSGLDRYLLGRPAAINLDDVIVLASFCLISWMVLIWKLPTLKIMLFDLSFAINRGISVRRYQTILSLFLVLGVGIGIQAVGAVLISAFLILPAIIARRFSFQISNIIAISVATTLFSAWLGIVLSYQNEKIATGAIIVFLLSSIGFLVFLCAPKTGLIAQYWQSKQKINRIAEENILKLLYEIGTEKNSFDEPIPEETLLTRRHFKKRKFKQTLVKMQYKNWIICNQEAIFLTEKGLVEAKKVEHLHLLWEKYLSEKMHFQHDHVHNMAELIEHVITPELEKMIQNDLDAGQKK